MYDISERVYKTEKIADAMVPELEVTLVTWIVEEEGPVVTQQKLELHPCTEEDLSHFYPINPYMEVQDKAWRDLMMCFDWSDIEIQGRRSATVKKLLSAKVRVPESACD